MPIQPLANQPTAALTRKMWAVLLATAATSVAKLVLMAYAPLLATVEVYDLIQAAMIVVTGYMVRDHA